MMGICWHAGLFLFFYWLSVINWRLIKKANERKRFGLACIGGFSLGCSLFSSGAHLAQLLALLPL